MELSLRHVNVCSVALCFGTAVRMNVAQYKTKCGTNIIVECCWFHMGNGGQIIIMWCLECFHIKSSCECKFGCIRLSSQTSDSFQFLPPCDSIAWLFNLWYTKHLVPFVDIKSHRGVFEEFHKVWNKLSNFLNGWLNINIYFKMNLFKFSEQ